MVETIEFDEDEDDELPMLLTQRDVVLMNKAGPLEEDVAEPAAQLANGDAQTVEMSEEERAMVAEADAAAAPVTTAADRAPDGVDAEQAVEEQRLPEAAPAPQVIMHGQAYCTQKYWSYIRPVFKACPRLMFACGLTFADAYSRLKILS